ncbi:MAG: GNAT family N-acetyltransferase [Defluviitaleaceae bacterium]|nr:GNAT family N-acetyltransferase [Defluviitaleaceae bacterium]
MADIVIREAGRGDAPLILEFIRELADYEKMADEVVATIDTIEEWIFSKKSAHVLFACLDGQEVGFAVYCYNFSTFVGRAGLYLEDIFVRPDFRGLGAGRALLRHMADIAVKNGLGRMEWQCLDWNAPSIDFYLSLGARQMNGWTTYRLAGEDLLNNS